MKSPAKILWRHAKIICSLGKLRSFRISEFPERMMSSRRNFCENRFATRAIYRIFRRGEHLLTYLILVPCTQLSFSYPSYKSEVPKSLFASILTPDS